MGSESEALGQSTAHTQCPINTSWCPHSYPHPRNSAPSFGRGLSLLPEVGWGRGEACPPLRPSSSRLSLLGSDSFVLFTPAPRIWLPNSRLELHFSTCKSGLIILPTHLLRAEANIGKVFWRQSCCLMKMTRLRLKFLLPDVEALPSQAPESGGGAGCPELSVLRPLQTAHAGTMVQSPPCHKQGPSEEGQELSLLPVTTSVTIAAGDWGKRPVSSQTPPRPGALEPKEGCVLPKPVWSVVSFALLLEGQKLRSLSCTRQSPL